eukprot:6608892-Prymnesium_polylepis.1
MPSLAAVRRSLGKCASMAMTNSSCTPRRVSNESRPVRPHQSQQPASEPPSAACGKMTTRLEPSA